MFKRFASILSNLVPARTMRRTWVSVNFPSSMKCALMNSASGLSFLGLGKMTQSSGTEVRGCLAPKNNRILIKFQDLDLVTWAVPFDSVSNKSTWSGVSTHDLELFAFLKDVAF